MFPTTRSGFQSKSTTNICSPPPTTSITVSLSIVRPSDSVQKILGNYAQFPGGHIMWQKRSIIQQIM